MQPIKGEAEDGDSEQLEAVKFCLERAGFVAQHSIPFEALREYHRGVTGTERHLAGGPAAESRGARRHGKFPICLASFKRPK